MWKVTIKGLLAHKLRLALTALAIVLGVTFIAGTFILTDTLHNTFDNLFGTIYSKVDFQVRGVAQFGSGGNATRNPVQESVLSTVRGVPGVQVAEGTVNGYAQYIGHDGKAISSGGAPTIGLAFDPDQAISPLHLVEGKAPTTSSDVVMDRGTAQKYGFSVGQKVRILLRGPTRTFTITGITKFGTADNLAGATLAAFDIPTAQAILGRVGQFDAINVVTTPGTDKTAVQRSIAAALPHGVEVVTGQTVVNEQTSSISSALSFFNTALLVFGFIALFVGGFTILNTFSIIVGQRTKELALLRIVGASRRQVFVSVLTRGGHRGIRLVAHRPRPRCARGPGPRGAAERIRRLPAGGPDRLRGPHGDRLPGCRRRRHDGLGHRAGTAGRARRAGRGGGGATGRVRDSDATAVHLGGGDHAGGRRRPCGRTDCSRPSSSSGWARCLIFIGVARLAPAVARPMASVLGRPLSRVLGMSGRLGRENSMRSPRRTAQTASALMVGLALVSAIAVFGSSLSSSATQSIDNAINADIIISPSSSMGSGSFGNTVSTTAAAVPGVTASSTVYGGQFEVRGAIQGLGAVTTRNLSDTVILNMNSGTSASLAAGDLLIDAKTASSDTLKVGDTVPVKFALTGALEDAHRRRLPEQSPHRELPRR